MAMRFGAAYWRIAHRVRSSSFTTALSLFCRGWLPANTLRLSGSGSFSAYRCERVACLRQVGRMPSSSELQLLCAIQLPDVRLTLFGFLLVYDLVLCIRSACVHRLSSQSRSSIPHCFCTHRFAKIIFSQDRRSLHCMCFVYF